MLEIVTIPIGKYQEPEPGYNEISNLHYDRKPVYFEDVKSGNSYDELGNDAKAIIDEAPLIQVEPEQVLAKMQFPTDNQFYLVVHCNKVFLIDTQGADYARYACKFYGIRIMFS